MAPQKKKGKARTPLLKPRPLKLKQAKLPQSEPRQRYLTSYETELGLQPVPTISNEVLEAQCKFCTAFGREEKPASSTGPFDVLLAKATRKKPATKKVFRSLKDMTKFGQLILPYKKRLRVQYGSGVISCIWKQVRKLRETYELNPDFKAYVDRSYTKGVVEAWRIVNGSGEYSRLVSFALGLASIPPGTHTVEGDFSSLKGVKTAHRGSLTNYALEGQLQAKQYFDLIPLASSIAAETLITK
ncbi:hypothetical protein GN244_ATG06317 [Phytophthora infestans]|uniref:Uncharacterized protein n=1 Tax=Phytophthora infestans TaxID=4787 RepID=A0A833SVL9_PHYIN|nr:hypothetical protein GN244_ATG06317 [Phytophthora infestans]